MLDQDTKNEVQAFHHDWMDGKDRKAAISADMKESVEAAAELLKMEKKGVRRLFKLMESFSPTEEYGILELCEELGEKEEKGK